MSALSQEIASNFIQFYYQQFNQDKSTLASFYTPTSMRTFESFQDQGTTAIMERITGMGIRTMNRRVSTFDVQPLGTADGAVICAITGELQIDEESNTQRFTHVLVICPSAVGNSVVIKNEIFRLNYC